MEELTDAANVVRRAALRGARSVSNRRQVVEDAVLRTVERWEEAVLKGKQLPGLSAWCFRVAANAARRSLSGRVRRFGEGEDVVTPTSVARDGEEASGNLGFDAGFRRTLLANLKRLENLLRGRQYEVLRKMAESGMTQARAAKDLGMDRANLRRAFRSGLARLRGGRK